MVVVLASSSARADATHDCVEGANVGQRLRDTGKLSSARDSFVRCSAEACPVVVRESCQRWSAEVETRLPSITPGAKDDTGNDLADVCLSIDGVVVLRTLDGRSIAVDPGPHELLFEASGFTPLRQSLIVREGEKARPVITTLTHARGLPAAVSGDPRAPRRDLTPLLITGGIAVVGLAGFTIFGLWGKSEHDKLASTCAPSETCPSGEVSAARTKWIVADVSLAASVIGAGLFTAFVFAPLFKGVSSSRQSVSPASVAFAPTRDGAFGTLRWSY